MNKYFLFVRQYSALWTLKKKKRFIKQHLHSFYFPSISSLGKIDQISSIKSKSRNTNYTAMRISCLEKPYPTCLMWQINKKFLWTERDSELSFNFSFITYDFTLSSLHNINKQLLYSSIEYYWVWYSTLQQFDTSLVRIISFVRI